MRAGRLNRLVELQRVTVRPDAHGDQTKEWTTLASVWGSLEELSGREFLQASQVMSDITARIRIRGRSDIRLTPKDRVAIGARLFDIRHVIDWGGKGTETQLMCTERFG